MKVLALDTALFGCSAALYDAGTGQCVSEQQGMLRGQAETLVPMVQRVLDKAGAKFDDLGLIVTTVGPGAFTGLRIGIAAAQGFGIALGKPVAGVTTLDVLAAMYFSKYRNKEQSLCVIIETKREDFYCQFFNPDGTPQREPQALPGEEIRALAAGQNIVFIGDGAGRFAQQGETVIEGFGLPDPCVIAARGLALWQAGTHRAAEPLYLRGADVTTSGKKQREILD